MQPAAYTFRITIGDTEKIGFRLRDRPLYGEERNALRDGAYAEWTIKLPSGDLVLTTRAGGGLVVEPASTWVYWDMSVTDTKRFTAGQPVASRVRLIGADGAVSSYLDATIIGEA